MSLKDLNLKTNYESGVDDLIEDFYVPALEKAVEYDRIAGFFSSTSLAISSRGISGLISNNGKMRLIVSPRLSAEDIESIKKADSEPEKILSESMIDEIENIEEFLTKNYVHALGWLIARGLLEIKVAIICNDKGDYLDYKEVQKKGIFHQKVGIIKDADDNIISFSGSINETANGWLNNVEEFKVFKFWQYGQREYCEGDINKFKDFWNNKRKNVKIIDIPEAVNKFLIDNAPRDISEIINIKNYIKLKHKEDEYKKLGLFNYQDEAVQMWLKNNKRLICEMATGTGKTRTAIGCIIKAISEEKPIAIFVVCPQNTLSLQWKTDIDLIGVTHDASIIVDATNRNWRHELEGKLLDIAIGLSRTLIIYTTHKTFSSDDFMNIIIRNKKNTTYMIIGDEAHGLGAGRTSKGLIEHYDYRLGLSATPKRWYDDLGTRSLYSFFGDQIFEFSIKQALNTINPITQKTYLTDYLYYPVFCTLTEEELERYEELTYKITKMTNSAKNDDKKSQVLENLLFKRASIHKSAENKYTVFEDILLKIDAIQDLIVFVSHEQIDKITNTLSIRNIRSHKFTEKEGNTVKKKYDGKTERQYIIDKFKEKKYQALVAIKCLDEGIDIPSAERAVILASSTNPREYIQRIGRVIRRHKDKSRAIIYDVIIKPDFKRMNKELLKLELKIFSKEMNRTLEIAENAMNNVEATKKVYDVFEEVKRWG